MITQKKRQDISKYNLDNKALNLGLFWSDVNPHSMVATQAIENLLSFDSTNKFKFNSTNLYTNLFYQFNSTSMNLSLIHI
jgi:hypothetical protein